MKINKAILLSVLGLGVCAAAQAGDVYLTGSTAARSDIYNTLVASGAVFTGVPAVTEYDGSATDPHKANEMIFVGTLVGGSGTTTLHCSWSGSDGGIDNVALKGTTSAARLANFANGPYDGVNHGTLKATDGGGPGATSHEVDLAMSDNIFNYAHAYGDPGSEGLAHAPADLTTGTQVAVVTFKWIRNNGSFTGNNVSSSQIRQALGGACPLAVFTGNPADTTKFVYVSGRTKDSGTRCNALGDSGWGVFKSVNQIEVDPATGNMVDLGGGNFEGDTGFTSGGTLAKTLGVSTTATTDQNNGGSGGFGVIAYLGFNDANTALTLSPNPAHELTYNGVAWSQANIKEGTYTFWGNEYIYTANSVSAEATLCYNNMAGAIPAHLDGSNEILVSSMDTVKANPEADPAHN
jgi:hypothetical protein